MDYNEVIPYIKERVGMRDLMRRYFVKMEGDKVCCPFHNDHSPSMGIKNNRYYCFACGEGGDVIDFVKNWHRVDIKEAIEIISSLYGFDFTPIKRVNTRERKETYKEWCRRLDRDLKDKYIEIRDMEYDKMCGRYLELKVITENESPIRKGGVFTNAYKQAIDELTFVEGWIDSYNNDMDRLKRGHLYGNTGTFTAI